MILRVFEAGPGRNLYYLLASQESGEAAVIDTGAGAGEILASARELGVKITRVINTHGHYDHIQENDVFARECGALFFCHPLSVENAAGMVDSSLVRTIEEGDRIRIGPDLSLLVWHTPGHHPGSVTLLTESEDKNEKMAFVGDTLFVDSDCGRADLRGGNITQLFQSLKRLASLPDETVIWPGHHYGAPLSRTMGEERRLNRTLACASVEELKRIKGRWAAE